MANESGPKMVSRPHIQLTSGVETAVQGNTKTTGTAMAFLMAAMA
jgi:hypothetical protein